jgi:ABC-type branched-subunit amino acid transport system substrate-binding protein
MMCERGYKATVGRRSSATLILYLSLAVVCPLSAAESLPAVDPHAIGCILPLSGRNAAYGNRALDAVLLAAGVFNEAKETPIRVLLEDSQSEAAVAGAAVEKLARAGAPQG